MLLPGFIKQPPLLASTLLCLMGLRSEWLGRAMKKKRVPSEKWYYLPGHFASYVLMLHTPEVAYTQVLHVLEAVLHIPRFCSLHLT